MALTKLYGGYDIPSKATNLIFSNGLLDPWSAAGVYGDDAPTRPGPYSGPLIQNVTGGTDVTALIIPLGAHHLDLMFMDDNDPPCATMARRVEVAAIRRWATTSAEPSSG